MNIRNIIIISATLALVACSSQDDPLGNKLDVPVAAEVSASIGESDTRVNGTNWDSTDAIGISNGSNYKNVKYNVADATSGTFEPTSGNGIFFDTSGDVTFTAYYPFSGLSGTAYESIPKTTSDQTMSKSFDFLWAEVKTTYKDPKINFDFKHKMTRLILNLQGDSKSGITSSDISGATYKLGGIKHSGSFNTATGTTTTTNTVTNNWDITNLATTSSNLRTFTMILFPQTVSKLTLSATIGGQNYVCEISNLELKAGTSYSYTITVKKTGLEVSNATITNWSTGTATATGTATYIDPFNGHPAVLMREASGTPGTADYVPALYFADRNIGAGKPEDIGAYFWWGDVVGYIPDQYINSDVTFTSMNGGGSSFSFSSSNSLTYQKSIDYLVNNDWVEEESPNNLLPSKDAAREKWGGNWRMPTTDDRLWLFNNLDSSTTISWIIETNSGYQYLGGDNTILVRVTESASTPIPWSNYTTTDPLPGDATTTLYTNGSDQVIPGVYVKSKSTGGVVFLPQGGNASVSKLLRIDSYVAYWTSTPYEYNTTDACYIVCQNKGLSPQSRTDRYMGLPIRPVMNK